MGLFDIFRKSDGNTGNSKVDRIAKRMLNEHHQQPVRQEAIDQLTQIGTPEAITALISRLGVNFRDTIKNEQEKRWITDTLVDVFGERAIEPLVGFIRTQQNVSAPIIVLARLWSDEKLVPVLLEVLEGYRPDDHRTIEPRLQIVDALADRSEDSRVVPALLKYAMDHDDQIRVKVVDVLQDRVNAQHPQYAETIDQLVSMLIDPEASSRITRRAADALIALDGNLGDRTELRAEFLPDGYQLADGKLKRV